MQKLKCKKGFTLIEIIVVLVILAILVAVALPTMFGYVEEARAKAFVQDARVGLLAAQWVVSEYVMIRDGIDASKSREDYAREAIKDIEDGLAADQNGTYTPGTLPVYDAFAAKVSGVKSPAGFLGINTDGEGKVIGIAYDTNIGEEEVGYIIVINDGVTTTHKKKYDFLGFPGSSNGGGGGGVDYDCSTCEDEGCCVCELLICEECDDCGECIPHGLCECEPEPCPDCAQVDCICMNVELAARRQVGWVTNRSTPVKITGNGTYEMEVTLTGGDNLLADIKILSQGGNIAGSPNASSGTAAHEAYADAKVTVNWVTSTLAGANRQSNFQVPHTFPANSNLLHSTGRVNIVLWQGEYVVDGTNTTKMERLQFVLAADTTISGAATIRVSFTITGVDTDKSPNQCAHCKIPSGECICTFVQLIMTRNGVAGERSGAVRITGNGTYEMSGTLPAGNAVFDCIAIRPYGSPNTSLDRMTTAPAAYNNAKASVNWITSELASLPLQRESNFQVPHTFPADSNLLNSNRFDINLTSRMSFIATSPASIQGAATFRVSFTITGITPSAAAKACGECARQSCICTFVSLIMRRLDGTQTRSAPFRLTGNNTYQITGTLPTYENLSDIRIRPFGSPADIINGVSASTAYNGAKVTVSQIRRANGTVVTHNVPERDLFFNTAAERRVNIVIYSTNTGQQHITDPAALSGATITVTFTITGVS